MPAMPVYRVGKGKQFGVYDIFNGTNEQIYTETLTLLRSPATLGELADQRSKDGGLTQHDVDHFRNDWLRDWWKGKHVETVLRAGIIKALETALPQHGRRLLPVEALWVCASDDVFHVYVNEGPHQVTIIVYTPTPPEYPRGMSPRDEKIWVIKTRDDDDTDAIAGPITRLNPGQDWPVLVERPLMHH